MFKMNNIIRSSFKLTSSYNYFTFFGRTVRNEHTKKQFFRTFWNVCSTSTEQEAFKSVKLLSSYTYCDSRDYSTKSSEAELSEFLTREINEEQKLQKSRTIPSKIDDFTVKLDGSEVTLTKETPFETITINFNINHSVSYDNDNEEENSEFSEVRSEPTFEIDIKRGDTVIGFTCSFTDGTGSNDEGDVFEIDEITSYKGEWDKKNYVVSGDILDRCLYDLMMNLLDEKGITNEFVLKMSDLSTAYEHSSYISLLRDLKQFAT